MPKHKHELYELQVRDGSCNKYVMYCPFCDHFVTFSGERVWDGDADAEYLRGVFSEAIESLQHKLYQTVW